MLNLFAILMLSVMSVPFSLKTVGNLCFLVLVRISFIVVQVFRMSFLN